MARAVCMVLLCLGITILAKTTPASFIRTVGLRGSNSTLRAGAAKINGTLPVGVPLAGYNHGQRRTPMYPIPKFTPYTTWMAPSIGVMDPTWVRALIIEEGGEQFGVVTIDAIGADSAMLRLAWEMAAAQGLQIPLENIVLGGSHSHSGPGGISPFFLWAIAPAIDLLVPELQLSLATSVANALLEAQAALQPAQLAIGVANLTTVTQNRRAGESPYVTATTIDPTLGVFRVETIGGEPIAVLWNFAIHGTCYGPENMYTSGDIMGKASEFIEEKLNVPALFVNSDAGDIDPTNQACSSAPNFAGSMNISTAVITVWNSLTPSADVQIASASQIVDFGPTDLNYTLARFNNCTSGGTLDICTICAAIHCDLNAHMPSSWIDNTPRFTAFRFDIGNTSYGIVTFPGEGLVELGWQVRNDTSKLDFDNTLIFGYSNSHMGYFATPNEYDVGGYESQLTLWGIQTAEVVRHGAVSTIATIAPSVHKVLQRK